MNGSTYTCLRLSKKALRKKEVNWTQKIINKVEKYFLSIKKSYKSPYGYSKYTVVNPLLLK